MISGYIESCFNRFQNLYIKKKKNVAGAQTSHNHSTPSLLKTPHRSRPALLFTIIYPALVLTNRPCASASPSAHARRHNCARANKSRTRGTFSCSARCTSRRTNEQRSRLECVCCTYATRIVRPTTTPGDLYGALAVDAISLFRQALTECRRACHVFEAKETTSCRTDGRAGCVFQGA